MQGRLAHQMQHHLGRQPLLRDLVDHPRRQVHVHEAGGAFLNVGRTELAMEIALVGELQEQRHGTGEQVFAGLGPEAGPRCEGVLVAGHRLAVIAMVLENVSEIVERLVETGLQFDGPPVVLHRRSRVGLALKNRAEIVVRLGVVGPAVERLLEAGFGLLGPSGELMDVAEIIEGLGESGVDVERGLETFRRGVEPAERLEQRTLVVVRLGEPGLQREGSVVGVGGVIELARILVGIAEVVQNLGIVGLYLQRRFIGGDGVAVAAQAAQRVAEIAVIIGIGRVRGDGFRDQFDRHLVLARLMGDDAQEMIGIRMVRSDGEDAFVDIGGFLQASASMGNDTRLQQLQEFLGSAVNGTADGGFGAAPVPRLLRLASAFRPTHGADPYSQEMP